MAKGSKEELEAKLQDFVGVDIGPPEPAMDPVNEAMIRHWCHALGDENPVYQDEEAAKASVHGGIVAPPTMMQGWTLTGPDMADPAKMKVNKQTELHALLTEYGYSSVVATNADQAYTRYMRPGDRVFVTTTIETISDEKATGLGIGYFINTRDVYRNQDGEELGWQTFRVLKFKPADRPAAPADESGDDGAPAPPTRLKPPLGHDNSWWWDGVNEDKLLIQKCSNCDTLRHPPRPMCGECRSTEWGTVESGGKGEVYSYVVMHYPKVPGYNYPMVCALVELEEGTRVVANVEGCEPSEVKIGMKVQVGVEDVGGGFKLPIFRPVG